jgi:hypothetical protein
MEAETAVYITFRGDTPGGKIDQKMTRLKIE